MNSKSHATRSLASLGLGVASLSFGALASFGSVRQGHASNTAADPAKLAALGKALFHDKTLSNPAGMACVSCHSPETGFSYPNSATNRFLGTVPGAIKERIGNRRPPSAAYAPYLPTGIPHYDKVAQAWVGGLFWDGRALDAVEQAKSPLLNPNEMNNCDRNGPSPQMVVRKLRNGPSSALFKRVYGPQVFTRPTEEVYDLAARAIVAYETSPEVSPFMSKYDAYLEGKAQFSAKELLGLRLTTGTVSGRPNTTPFKKSAHCMDCHAASSDLAKAPDIWTNSCYANLGVPKNRVSGYFSMTNRSANPAGYNSFGSSYVDVGLGGFVYPHFGWPPRTLGGSDPLRIMGTFKAPTLRNVDKRPYLGFVKCYMHNGVFKSLKEVVHFYNTRNLTTVAGEVIDFTKADPYAGLKGTPLWPRPEFMDPTTLINPGGVSGNARNRTPKRPGFDLDAMQIGNLRLTDSQEDAIVAFLKTLSDGYYVRRDRPHWKPAPIRTFHK